jgi:SAM-dependent methyltransferase
MIRVARTGPVFYSPALGVMESDMAVGRLISGDEGHIAGFREALDDRAGQTPDTFFTFFNDGADWRESYLHGAWDFSTHIAGPLCGRIGKAADITILDVGYGGGRLLASAARHFGRVIGIDIHRQSGLVLDKLTEIGVTNATLLETDGTSFPLPDASIDATYSFIVFQHMEKLAIAENNLREIYRVLKPGGLALIYFGRVSLRSAYKESRLLALADILIESLGLCPDHQELTARVNQVNLRISLKAARRLCRSIGFGIIGYGLSRRRPPQEANRFGGQSYLLLAKP